MNSIVIYATRYGSTEQVAEAIADELQLHGTVQLLSVDDVAALPAAGVDLVVVGGPTEGHGMTEPVARFLDRVGASALCGKAIAAFDTRYRWPSWLSGSASAAITRRLRRVGARVVTPPESFFVAGGADHLSSTDPMLETGEIEHARAWADTLADSVETSAAGTASRAM